MLLKFLCNLLIRKKRLMEITANITPMRIDIIAVKMGFIPIDSIQRPLQPKKVKKAMRFLTENKVKPVSPVMLTSPSPSKSASISPDAPKIVMSV